MTLSRQEPRDQFEVGFVAMSYLLERRGARLTAGLAKPRSATHALVARLQHPDRQHRAHALAVGLAPIVRALDSKAIR
jgi:hypothetical protein